MLRSYLTVALRNLRREKVYAGINIAGLAVALACGLLVFLYLRHEFSFDRYHEKVDQIYRIVEYRGFSEESRRWDSGVSGDPVPEMRTSYTEVEDAVQLSRFGAERITYGSDVQRDVQVALSESNLFNIFSFDLVHGDPETVLDRPNTAVITRSLAERVFEEEPVGKTLVVPFYGEERSFEITGVMEDVPENSHFTFDLLLSYESLRSTSICLHCGSTIVYVLLKPGTGPDEVGRRVLERIQKVDGKEHVHDLRLEPLAEAYFSEVWSERKGDRSYVKLLSGIALVMLLIACANYMNLATARSARRVREVGVRKALGAQRSQLVRQFLAEATLMVLLAVPLALILLVLALPYFNDLADTAVSLSWRSMAPLLVACTGALVIVGLVGGSYPALYLSAFEAVEVLKGGVRNRLSAPTLRKLLVVLQFSASVALLIATVVVLRQLEFMREQKLGFDADQIVLVRVTDPKLIQDPATLKQEFLRTAGVVHATAGHGLPGQSSFAWRRFINPLGDDGPQIALIQPAIDADFLEALGIPLVAGRNIKDGPGRFGSLEGLLNETALRALGWTSPEEAIGKELSHGTIVGVVEDFNFESLHNPIRPLMLMQNDQETAGTVGLRIDGRNVRATVAALERTWKRVAPGEPFEFSFLRDELNQLYEREQRAAKVFGLFAGLAIFIGCLGLFGLAAFAAEQRTKEIGVRKVLGATVPGLVALLSRDFLRLVLAAFVVAAPVAYFAMQRWLEDFAFRIEIHWTIFAGAALAVALVALLTVGFQAVKAASANPVDCLRYE